MSEPLYRNRQPRYRAARRQAMRESGTRPANKEWVVNVEPKSLCAIPDYFLERAVKGLGEQSGRVWLWPTDARELVNMDRAAGGLSVVRRVEFRRCEMCARPLLGDEAIRRRQMDESGPAGRALPCGEHCQRDRDTRIWKKLTPTARTRSDCSAAQNP